MVATPLVGDRRSAMPLGVVELLRWGILVGRRHFWCDVVVVMEVMMMMDVDVFEP